LALDRCGVTDNSSSAKLLPLTTQRTLPPLPPAQCVPFPNDMTTTTARTMTTTAAAVAAVNLHPKATSMKEKPAPWPASCPPSCWKGFGLWEKLQWPRRWQDLVQQEEWSMCQRYLWMMEPLCRKSAYPR
ncbi:unnamed protein product, partial [Sphacelaria rigidula]